MLAHKVDESLDFVALGIDVDLEVVLLPDAIQAVIVDELGGFASMVELARLYVGLLFDILLGGIGESSPQKVY